MSRWWWCCGGPCWSVEDDFNRPDSSDIGDVLVEQYGDAEIQSNRLFLPGGVMPSGAVVYTRSRHPKKAASGLVYATAKNTVEGGKYRLLINYNPETELGHYVDLEQTATKRILTLSTGPSGESYESPGSDMTLILCYAGKENGILEAYASGPGPIWDRADPVSGGWYAGLANPSDQDILFDDFKFEEHRETNPICPCCWCSCDGIMPSRDQPLTIILEATGCLAPANGATGTLTLDPAFGKMEYKEWTGLLSAPVCDMYALFSLRCFTEDCLAGVANWRLIMWNLMPEPPPIYRNWYSEFGWDRDIFGDCRATPIAGSTCDPFSLRFGPFDVPPSPSEGPEFDVFPPCCVWGDNGGTYWFHITE